ncbi:hypothetical protein BDB00DRAFT_798289 [Zychaea mexicana]|uniref:uncharacterized protein n=1 Tax=Zychaea mexicana TaxID=64656 RepID=UPI0022FE3560|nr:uncharacterized protein BDB00DRAFT_798289 [Zychaea mexicana]KAI9499091.1 hypothetical protein BDB00DRAFT_798289 [Zychaea mexicana]
MPANTSSPSSRKNNNNPGITISTVPPATSATTTCHHHQRHIDSSISNQQLAFLPHTTRLSYDSLPISSNKTSYADRRKSAGALPRANALTTPTLNRDELNHRIADSFQEFSNMLTQMSAAKQHQEQQQKNQQQQRMRQPKKLPPAPLVVPTTAATYPLATRNLLVETPRSLSPLLQQQQLNQQQQHSGKIRQSTESIAFVPSIASTASSCATFPSLASDDLREQISGSTSCTSTISSCTDDEYDHRPSISNTAAEEDVYDGDSDSCSNHGNSKKVMQRLARAICIGDTRTITSVLQQHPWVNVNQPDELGVTLLIHAACFNRIQVVRPLLEAGASIDRQDKKGWTALMWAVNSKHVDMVRLLLDCGASRNVKTFAGFSIHRLVDPQDSTMISLIPSPTPPTPPSSLSSSSTQINNKTKTSPIFQPSSSATTTMDINSLKKKRRASHVPKLDQVDLIYYQADMYGYADIPPTTPTTANSSKRSSISSCCNRKKNAKDEYEYEEGANNSDDDVYDEEEEEEEDLEGWEGCIRSIYQFDWDKCLPDQMFVFCQDDMSYILNTVINDVKLPLVSADDTRLAANVIFLCCRFAYYHSRRDFLQEFLTRAINKIAKVIKANSRNIDCLGYWISNSHMLYLYLRRDRGLADVTRDEQQQIAQQLTSEAFALLVSFTQKRLDKFIEPALLDYEEITDEHIDFVGDSGWQRFFRRSSTSSTASHTSTSTTTQATALASTSRRNSFLLSSAPTLTPPSTLTSIIASVTQTMDSYDMHPEIKEQLIMQCLQFVAWQGFNRLLGNKKYLCRSRAIHVRMNVSVIEEWIRHTALGHSVSCFQPLAQLLQLLQCVSQLHDLRLFQETTAGFDLLSAVQIRRCVLHYRYEINEPQLPEGVLAFIQKDRSSSGSSNSNSSMAAAAAATAEIPPRNSCCSNACFDMAQTSVDGADLCAFVVPNQALKRDHGIVPSIPERWLLKLDKK